MPNEMPPDRHRESIHFGKCLLHAVFSNVAQARVACGLYRVRAVRLGDRNDCDRLTMTAAPHGGGDSVTHFS
jgi:hypothetical protein